MGSYYWNTTTEDFLPESLDAIKEHCMSNYLPFDGGLWQNFQPRNYTLKPNKRAKFYVVEYHPDIKIWQPPKLHTEESYFKDREESDWYGFFKWGTERGMKFYYGIDGSGIDYNKISLEASVFKVGLTHVKVKMRGGKRYKNILVEKDITDLKIPPEDYETFVYAKLFYKYWKDKNFFKGLKTINQDHMHEQLQFDGKTESFRFENVEDKLKIVREAMDQIENSPPEEIKKEVDYFCFLTGFWNMVVRYKKSFPCFYSFDNYDTIRHSWENYNTPLYIDPMSSFINMYEWAFSLKCPFLIDIGFKDKWLMKTPEEIRPLFDKPLEDFILPNSTHYDLT